MSVPELGPGEVCPRRFGLNYDPPAIILEYLEVSTGKLFHRKVAMKRLRASTDPARIAEKLRQVNRPLLTEEPSPPWMVALPNLWAFVALWTQDDETIMALMDVIQSHLKAQHITQDQKALGSIDKS
ncbi:Centrosomal protein of 19 kDa [Durusdinium trenchii]|uniref:Centrosomal protein of 19 kDa n=1 Tax=Durusdinium trenchii TaxID=1381693 RepID=A0ABP0HVG7_9DINO